MYSVIHFPFILNVTSRFEKSLYDLIRGLRNHKGKEHDYIQESLRECRKEIKSQDMGSCDIFHLGLYQSLRIRQLVV